MIEIEVPGQRTYKFKYLVLDLNGTLSLDGELIEGVLERIESLQGLLNIMIITADTMGKAQKLGEELQIKIIKVQPGNEQVQKLELVKKLGTEITVAIGNGANDVQMLSESALGICAIGPEGTSVEAIKNCDVVVSDIKTALDLLIKPERLIATLRK